MNIINKENCESKGKTRFFYISVFMFFSLIMAILSYRVDLSIATSNYGLAFFLGLYVVTYFNEIQFDRINMLLIIVYIALNSAGALVTGRSGELGLILREGMVFFFLIALIPAIIKTEKEILSLYKVINIFSIIMLLMKWFSLFELEQYVYILYVKNSWAQTMMIPAFISFYLYRRENKLFYLICSCLYFYSVIMSLSRTAIIAGVVFLYVYVLLSSGNNLKKNFWTMNAIIVTVVIVINRPVVSEFIAENLYRGDTNLLSYRDLLWESAFSAFESNPFFGIGREMATQYIANSGNGFLNVREFHNYYLEVLSTQGIFSLMFFLAIAYKSTKACLFMYKDNREDGAFYIGVFSAFLVYMLAESFYPYRFAYNNILSGLMLFAVPLTYNRGKIFSNSSDKIAVRRKSSNPLKIGE